MRFMVIVKASKNSEAGVLPTKELLEAMGKYNEELIKAGVMLAGEGLQRSSKGARIKFSGEKKIVSRGPFALTRDLVAGFWLWKCKSLELAFIKYVFLGGIIFGLLNALWLRIVERN